MKEEDKITKQQAMLEEQHELANARVSIQKTDLKAELEVLAQKKEIEATRAEMKSKQQNELLNMSNEWQK